MNRRYEHLLSPIRVRNFVLKNRMINSQSVSQELQGPQIYPDEPYQRYTTDYAKNGAAMVNITIGSWPDEKGRHGPMDQFYMENRKVLNAYAKQIDRIHAFSSLVSGNVMVNFGRTQISEIHDESVLTFRGTTAEGRGLSTASCRRSQRNRCVRQSRRRLATRQKSHPWVWTASISICLTAVEFWPTPCRRR